LEVGSFRTYLRSDRGLISGGRWRCGGHHHLEDEEVFMRKKVLLLPLVVFLALAVSACAPKISVRGKALMVLSTYNAQTASTLEMSHRPNLTEAQKENVRQKKAVIKKLDPLVKTYGLVVDSGGVPSAGTEQDIYNLIDDLVALGL
jgi:hypothetical protein